jgi:hypothetical protein
MGEGGLLGPRATARQATPRSSREKQATSPTRFSLPTKISKTTPCKVTGSLEWMLPPRKHFDTSGKSAAPFHHRAICKTAHGPAQRPLWPVTSQNPRQLKFTGSSQRIWHLRQAGRARRPACRSCRQRKVSTHDVCFCSMIGHSLATSAVPKCARSGP